MNHSYNSHSIILVLFLCSAKTSVRNNSSDRPWIYRIRYRLELYFGTYFYISEGYMKTNNIGFSGGAYSNMVSPEVRLNTTGCLKFALFLNGTGVGSLTLNRLFGPTFKQQVWQKIGNQGVKWIKVALTLQEGTFKLIFKTSHGPSDVAMFRIDNITLSTGTCDKLSGNICNFIFILTVLIVTFTYHSIWDEDIIESIFEQLVSHILVKTYKNVKHIHSYSSPLGKHLPVVIEIFHYQQIDYFT